MNPNALNSLLLHRAEENVRGDPELVGRVDCRTDSHPRRFGGTGIPAGEGSRVVDVTTMTEEGNNRIRSGDSNENNENN